MKFVKYILFLSIIIVLYACAQITPLSGGDKDVIPPEAKFFEPQNYSTKFNSKKVTIEFNEFIKLNNLQNQLLISPVIENSPEISVRGKRLIINFKDTFARNTTYSLNFNDAIVDITENNPYSNFKYVFSSGNKIDSLSYAGTLVNAQTLKPTEDSYVMLYGELNDSIPIKSKPDYITKANKDGSFKITNIAPGLYKVFALKDMNSNYMFDLPNEEVAFLDKNIRIDSAIGKQLLYMFEEDYKKQFVVSTKHNIYGKVDIEFNKTVDSLIITPLNQSFKKAWNILDQLDEKNYRLWLTATDGVDSLVFQVADNSTIIDTLAIKLKSKSTLKDSLLVFSGDIANSKFDLYKNYIIETKHPIINFDQNKIILLEDSTQVSPKIKVKKENLKQLVLDFSFKEKTDYSLLILPEAIQDIFKLTNDSLKVNFVTQRKSYYGGLEVNLNPSFNKNYILQLLNTKSKIVNEQYLQGNQQVVFSNLHPGDYQLKIIIDENNNKKWDTGKYIEKRQPEKVIIYKKNISVKSNWTNSIKWTVNL